MDLKDKFNTVFQHVDACGEAVPEAESTKAKRIMLGKREVRISTLKHGTRCIAVILNNRLLMMAALLVGKPVFMIDGHSDGLELIHRDVIKQPL